MNWLDCCWHSTEKKKNQTGNNKQEVGAASSGSMHTQQLSNQHKQEWQTISPQTQHTIRTHTDATGREIWLVRQKRGGEWAGPTVPLAGFLALPDTLGWEREMTFALWPRAEVKRQKWPVKHQHHTVEDGFTHKHTHAHTLDPHLLCWRFQEHPPWFPWPASSELRSWAAATCLRSLWREESISEQCCYFDSGLFCCCVRVQPPEVFICVEVKPLSVFLPLLSLYEGMELMMACRYFSCSRLVESAWEGTAGKETCRDTLWFKWTTIPSLLNSELWKSSPSVIFSPFSFLETWGLYPEICVSCHISTTFRLFTHGVTAKWQHYHILSQYSRNN